MIDEESFDDESQLKKDVLWIGAELEFNVWGGESKNMDRERESKMKKKEMK